MGAMWLAAAMGCFSVPATATPDRPAAQVEGEHATRDKPLRQAIRRQRAAHLKRVMPCLFPKPVRGGDSLMALRLGAACQERPSVEAALKLETADPSPPGQLVRAKVRLKEKQLELKLKFRKTADGRCCAAEIGIPDLCGGRPRLPDSRCPAIVQAGAANGLVEMRLGWSF